MLLSLVLTKHSRTKPVRNGFTLLEMLVVVSIILVFATVAVPKFTSAGKTAKVAKIKTDIRTISNAAALYEIDNGKFPAAVSDLVSVDKDGKGYLQFEPKLPDNSVYSIDASGVVKGTYDKITYDSTTDLNSTSTTTTSTTTPEKTG